MGQTTRCVTPLTQSELKKIWRYDPATGFFTRIAKTGYHCNVGDVATCKSAGYVIIRVDNKLYRAHRLAFLYMTGKWPDSKADHINGIRDDNRWANLRDVTHSVNLQNLHAARSDNKSGFLGVYWDKGTEKWRAQIKSLGAKKHIGLFDDPHVAHLAYLAVKRQHHAGCTI